MIVTINFQGRIVLAFFLGSIVGKLYLIFIHPLLALNFQRAQVPFPDDKQQLKDKIIALANKFKYPDPERKIMLTEDRGGDMHSNAGVNSLHINLSRQLLEHHEEDDEILAILTHEFGHWSRGDIYITAVFDVIYMTLLGVFFEHGLNNPYLLKAFGFSQQSVFISVYLFYKVYSVTLDYPQRKLFNVLYRNQEYNADMFAAKHQGTNVHIKNSLLRNYSKNLDALFVDEVHAMLQKSHPTLLERLKALDDYVPEVELGYNHMP